MVRTKASVVWCSLRVAYRRSTCEARAWSAIMRPKRSVEMPPTNPAGAPRRAMPTAMFRQDPPATGTAASRPSTDATGRKSIRASPQLSSMALMSRANFRNQFELPHGIAAFSIQRSHQFMNPSLGPMEVDHSGRRRLAQAADRRHRGHRLADRSVGTAGHRTQHGSAEQDRFLGFWNRDAQPGRIRHDLTDQRTPTGAAGNHHQVAVDAVAAESVDDIGQAIGKPAQSRHEQPFHRADVGIEIEARDDRTRIRIGEWRPVADELGKNMNVAGQQRGLPRTFRAREDAPLQEFQNFNAAGTRSRDGLVISRMRPDQMIDRSTSGGLAALVEP